MAPFPSPRRKQHIAALAIFCITSPGIAAVARGNPASPDSATLPIGGDARFRERMLGWQPPPPLAGGGEDRATAAAVMPVEHSRLTSRFGPRLDPLRGTVAAHAGVDMATAAGSPVRATADGRVDRAIRAGGYGNLVVIDHGGGVQSRYAHLSRLLVRPDEAVRRGQIIALAGSTGRSTGSHLHYEVRINGRPVDPMRDPGPHGPGAFAPATSEPPHLSAFARAQAGVAAR